MSPVLHWTHSFSIRKDRTTIGVIGLELYYPKRDLNIFPVILFFFRPFRYGKNALSRSRGTLSPGASSLFMVVYVVKKTSPPSINL